MPTKVALDFELVDENTVDRLNTAGTETFRPVNADKAHSAGYNEQRVTSSILTSVLTGESNPDAAARLSRTANLGASHAKTVARTSLTNAHNAGRQCRYEELQTKTGKKFLKQWLATGDERTRASHLAINGEIVEVDRAFSNGLKYPADVNGAASEVYNCRCSMRMVTNYETAVTYQQKAEETFSEWLVRKQEVQAHRFVPKTAGKAGTSFTSNADNGIIKQRTNALFGIDSDAYEMTSVTADYRKADGTFDLDHALRDYRTFIDEFPEGKRTATRLSLDAVSIEQKKLDGACFGYSSENDTIYYDTSKEDFWRFNFSVAMTHELQHRTDYFFFESYRNREFVSAIANAEESALKNADELAEYCATNYRYGFLSDITSAITGGKIDLPAGHEIGYWNSRTKAAEVFANIASLEAFCEVVALDFIEQHFPEIMSAYKALGYGEQ